MKQFKYHKEIEEAVQTGASLPELLAPNNKEAFRFVFSTQPERNHLPVCVSNPKRLLPPAIRTSGYALSCFGTEEKALLRYATLKRSFKLIAKTIGDGLSQGVISNDNGMITKEEIATSHFDFYEFECCNPTDIFTFKTVIP